MPPPVTAGAIDPAETAAPSEPPPGDRAAAAKAVRLASSTEKTSKLSLQLKKPKAKADATPAIPGLPPAATPDAAETQVAGPPPPTASSTVAISMPDEPDAGKTVAIAAPEADRADATVAIAAPEDDEEAGEQKKGGLKLKSGKKAVGGPSAVVAKEKAERLKASGATRGKPSILVVMTSLASATAAGVALGFMIMDFLQYCK